MKKIVAICILAIISAATVFQVYAQSNGQFPQNGTILGRVMDSRGQSIEGAEISYYIEDAVKANRASGSGIITDPNGNYAIEYSMTPSDLAANVGKLFITVKVGDQSLTRGGPADSIEIKGGTTIKVDFQLGGASGQPPAVLIQRLPNTSATESSTSSTPITSSANPLSAGGSIIPSEDNNLASSTTVKSSTPGFDAFLALVGIVVVYILMRKT